MKKKLWRIKLYIIAKEFFQYSLVTYIFLLITETIQEGIVSYFFNPSILVVIILGSGILMIVMYNEKIESLFPQKKTKKREILWNILLACVGAFLVAYKTQDLGVVPLVMGCFTFTLVLIISFILQQKNSPNSN